MLYDLFFDASFWILGFVSMFPLFYFVCNLVVDDYDERVSLKDIVFVLILTTFTGLFFHITKNSNIPYLYGIKLTVVTFLTITYFKLEYKVSSKNIFLAVLIYYATGIIFENIIISIHSTFFDAQFNEITMTIYNILISVIILLYTKTNIYKELKKICTHENSTVYLISNYVLLLTSIILTAVNIVNCDISSTAIYAKFFLSISIVTVFLVNSRIYCNYIELSDENKMLTDNIKDIENIINTERMINHEYKNQVKFVNSMIDKNSAALPYINNLIIEESSALTYLNELNYLKCLPIRIFITGKLNEFNNDFPELKIGALVLRSTADAPFEILTIKQIQNITKILGVFLDNAQQAAISTKSKNLDVFISFEYNFVDFSIFNTFDEVNENLTTTKGDRHGYGLKLVDKIVSEEERFERNTSIDHDKKVFKQTLVVDVEK